MMAHRQRISRTDGASERSVAEPKKPFLYRALHSIVTLKGSPEAIALGTAIGVFIAFTPTVGLQMLLGAFVATLVGASRPAAMIPAWITNPATIPPIFAFTYWVGSLFWYGPPVSQVYQRLIAVMKGMARLDWAAFYGQFMEFLKVGKDIFVPLLIGGIIIGAVCAAISYPIVLWTVRGYRRGLRKLRLKHSPQTVAEPLDAAGLETDKTRRKRSEGPNRPA